MISHMHTEREREGESNAQIKLRPIIDNSWMFIFNRDDANRRGCL